MLLVSGRRSGERCVRQAGYPASTDTCRWMRRRSWPASAVSRKEPAHEAAKLLWRIHPYEVVGLIEDVHLGVRDALVNDHARIDVKGGKMLGVGVTGKCRCSRCAGNGSAALRRHARRCPPPPRSRPGTAATAGASTCRAPTSAARLCVPTFRCHIKCQGCPGRLGRVLGGPHTAAAVAAPPRRAASIRLVVEGEIDKPRWCAFIEGRPPEGA